MTDVKLWIWILMINAAMWLPSYIPASELGVYYWWSFLAFFTLHVFTSISQYLKYRNKIESFSKEVRLNANEKWDFLYQDVWVPFAFLILVLCFLLMNFNEKTFVVFISVLQLGEVIFSKIILRNKLIIEEDKMTYSDKAVFSEIEFGEIKSVVFDDNMGKIDFAFFQKNLLGNISNIEENVLDSDGESSYGYSRKEFLRRGLFLEDWKRIGEILNEKSKEFGFELDIIEAVKVKY